MSSLVSMDANADEVNLKAPPPLLNHKSKGRVKPESVFIGLGAGSSLWEQLGQVRCQVFTLFPSLGCALFPQAFAVD